MGLLFWRRTRDIAPQNSEAIAVTETTPLPVELFHSDDNDISPVKIEGGYVDPAVSTPTVYNVSLDSATTQYSLVLPAGCRRFEFQCRTAFDVIFAFEAGRVAAPTTPYMTLKASDYYDSGPIHQTIPSTLYLASATAGVVVEIITWV